MSSWKNIGAAVASAAPLLGGVVGGPIGAAAGTLIASIFGVEATPDAVNEAIKSDPDAMLKLKSLENEHRGQILEWFAEQQRIEAEDRKDARKASVDSGDRRELLWLSLFLFCVAFGMEFYIISNGFDARISGELVGRILGTLDTLAVTLAVFWFGTARSNQRNDERLYNSTPPPSSTALLGRGGREE